MLTCQFAKDHSPKCLSGRATQSSCSTSIYFTREKEIRQAQRSPSKEGVHTGLGLFSHLMPVSSGGCGQALVCCMLRGN